MIGSVNSSCCLEKLLGFVWVGKWKSGRIENGERIEKWTDRKDLVFSYMCLVGRVKKWRDGKLFCLIEKKSERIENKVCINLPLYPI